MERRSVRGCLPRETAPTRVYRSSAETRVSSSSRAGRETGRAVATHGPAAPTMGPCARVDQPYFRCNRAIRVGCRWLAWRASATVIGFPVERARSSDPREPTKQCNHANQSHRHRRSPGRHGVYGLAGRTYSSFGGVARRGGGESTERRPCEPFALEEHQRSSSRDHDPAY